MSALEMESGFIRWLTHRPRSIRLLLAIACPLIATTLALPLPRASATSTVAAMVYLLAVVGAAVIGGLRGGLFASVISFLGLNFFFTPPFHTFEVEKPEDLVALLGFLIVSSIVANLFTQLMNQRERAERRERETGLLYHLASQLLGRESTAGVLDEFTRDLAGILRLSVCEVYVAESDGELKLASRFTAGQISESGRTFDIPLKTDREEFGVVRVIPRVGTALDDEDLALAHAFVTQVALAMESVSLQEKTRSAQSEAEASRIRAALFSSVTHDLRTPLSSIKASATSLLEEGVAFDSQQREELLRTIAEESDRLNRLIGNLLDLSRLRAGALVPEKLPTPIEDVIDSVVSRLGKIFGDRQVQVRIREGIPPVPMDVMQIDQVLSNLLENAAVHAAPNSDVEIRATKWQSSVEVEVSDHGTGIPAGEREKVFEEFYRRDGGGSKRGAGLGLSIARAIVQAHGGQIWIRETPGGGTAVVFRLPYAATPEE